MADSMEQMAGLAGRVAMATGGSRGIGAATGIRLARHGALVGVGGRDVAAIEQIVDRIRADGGRAVATPPDKTHAGALEHAFTVLAEQFGPVDLLAAFAGGNGQPQPTDQVTPARWRAVLEGDLTSTFLTIRAALPTTIEQGRGSIVTMASSAARQPSQAAAACCRQGRSRDAVQTPGRRDGLPRHPGQLPRTSDRAQRPDGPRHDR